MDKNRRLEYQKELLSRMIRGRTDLYGYFVRERQGVFSDTLAQLRGIPTVIRDMPEWMVAEGHVGPDGVEAWRDFFAAADRGERSGSAMVTLKTEDGYGWYWLRFNMVDGEDGQPLFAVVSLDDFTSMSQQLRMKDNDINGLLQATRKVFPEILTINVTQGAYRIIQYDSATSMGSPRTGGIDELISTRLKGVAPEDRERFAAAFSMDRLGKLFSEDAEESIQLVYRRPGLDGKTYWMETTVMRQENSAGSDLLLVAVSRSVDQQKAEEARLREAMRQQAEELRLTMSQIGKTLNYYDIAAGTMTMPPAQAGKFGLPTVIPNFPESFIAHPPPGYPPETLETIRGLYDEIRRGDPAGSCEYRVVNQEGKDVWVRLEFATIFDEKKRPVRSVVASENITRGYVQTLENRQLKENEYLLRLTAQHSDRTICHYDVQKQTARVWDPKSCARCQLPRLCEMSAQEVLTCGKILPESVEEVRGMFRDIQAGKPNGTIKMRATAPSGERRWFDLQYSTIFDSQDAPVSALISHKDVTEQYEHELAFQRYKQAVEFDEAGHLLILEVDVSSDWIEKVSGELLPTAERETQNSFSAFRQRMMSRKFLYEDREEAARYFSQEALLERYAQGERRLASEWRARFHDGTFHWLDTEIQLMADPYTGHVKAFIRMRDITEEKEAQEDIRRRSERDGMTGLYNRATAEERVRALVDGKRHPGILILLDLDDLKGINDTFGHKEGDRALTGIADTLTGHFRDSDIVARIGGDEFLVYLPGAAENKDVIAISLSNLLRKLAGISIGAGDERRIHCSIGCAVQGRSADSYEALFKQADTALYQVKRGGKNNFVFYEPEMDQADYQFRERKLSSPQRAKGIDVKELRCLLSAIAPTYPLVLSVNLSANQYSLMEGSGGFTAGAPEFGALDDFGKLAKALIHPDDATDAYGRLSREEMLAAYGRGEAGVRCRCRVRQGDGYRWAEVSAVFYTNENGDVCDFTLFRWTEGADVLE